MTKFVDRFHQEMEIEMKVWNPDTMRYDPPYENDFFDIGTLEYDEDADAYKVRDCDYLAAQAIDWKYGLGDYKTDTKEHPGFKGVWIDGEYMLDGDTCWITNRDE